MATTACSTTLPYARIDRALRDGNPAEGIAILEQTQSVYGSRSEALYLMDKGMVQHLAGRHADSIHSLSKAESLTEELSTARIRSEIAAFLTSDNALPYEGEAFEKVLLNVFMAVNYAQLGLWDDALVEARKVDHKLTVLSDQNQHRLTYSADPLARYVSGVLYEAAGDQSNAFVAYRLARDAFEHHRKAYGTPTPDLLRRDLLRLSETLGLAQEHEEYRQAFHDTARQAESASQDAGEIIFITYAGRAPIKRNLFVDIPFSTDALGLILAANRNDRRYASDSRAAESILYGLNGRIVRLAVPQFVPRRSAIAFTEAVVSGGPSRYASRSAVMEDITAIAVKDLEERLLRTIVKAVARAAWKVALAEAVRAGVREAVGHKEGGALAGAVAGAMARMVAIASEEADTRSWATLPDRIHVGRLRVPPGAYDVELRHVGLSGDVMETQVIRGVAVTERGTRFISARVLR